MIMGELEEELLEEDHVDAADFADKGREGYTAGTGSGVAMPSVESRVSSDAVPAAAVTAAVTAAPTAAVAPGAASHAEDARKDNQVRFASPVEGGGESINGQGVSDLHAQGSVKPLAGGSPAGAEKKAATPADRAVRFGIPATDEGAAAAATKSSGASDALHPAPAMDPAEEEKRRKRARKFELGEKTAKELQAEEAAVAAATRAKRAKAEPPSSPRAAVGATGAVGGAPASAAAVAAAAKATPPSSSGKGSARKLAPPVPLDEVELAKRALRAKRFSCK